MERTRFGAHGWGQFVAFAGLERFVTYSKAREIPRVLYVTNRNKQAKRDPEQSRKNLFFSQVMIPKAIKTAEAGSETRRYDAFIAL